MKYRTLIFSFVFLTCSFLLFAQQGEPGRAANLDGKATRPDGPPAGARTPEHWKALIQERKLLAIRHDIVAWSKFVPDDVVWINDYGQFQTKPQMQLQNSQSNPQKLLSSDADDFRVMDLGDTIVLIYRATQRVELNAVTSIDSYQTQETYSRQSGEWRLKVYHETSIPPKPRIITVDPKVLEDYLGQYEVGPQDVITLKRTGDKLMAYESNFPTTEWQPESESTFSDGQGHVQFLRNKDGEVTGLVFYPAGQVVQAKRAKP